MKVIKIEEIGDNKYFILDGVIPKDKISLLMSKIRWQLADCYMSLGTCIKTKNSIICVNNFDRPRGLDDKRIEQTINKILQYR